MLRLHVFARATDLLIECLGDLAGRWGWSQQLEGIGQGVLNEAALQESVDQFPQIIG